MTLKPKRRRIELAMLVALSGGTTLQIVPGCGELFGQAGAATIDFCFLFDCQTGFFGGLFQPCPQAGFSLFVDCPQLNPPFGTGLGTAAAGQGGQGAAGGQGAQGGGRGGFGPAIQQPGGQGAPGAMAT